MDRELHTSNAPAAVFVIAEAGSNWRVGTPEQDHTAALALIDAAKAAGADAVKFQVFRAVDLYAPDAGKSDYLAAAGVSVPINQLVADLEMPYGMVPALADHCRAVGIEFMTSAFSPADLAAVDPYVRRHKIASYEINHVSLLVAAASTGKPIIISTGAATEDDIEFCVTTLTAANAGPLTLLQCTAAYPAPPESLNLMTLPWLSERFGLPVGLSDHSTDPLVGPVAAVALGAQCIEKHMTLDRALPGPDQAFAIVPDELAHMVQAIRTAEAALGERSKTIQPAEEELRQFAVRAIQARVDIAEGDELVPGGNIDLLRPGKRSRGMHPRYLVATRGRRALRGIAAGDGVTREDVDPPIARD